MQNKCKMHRCRRLTPLVSAHLIGCRFIPQFRNDFRANTSKSSSLEVHNRHLFTQYKPTDPYLQLCIETLDSWHVCSTFKSRVFYLQLLCAAKGLQLNFNIYSDR